MVHQVKHVCIYHPVRCARGDSSMQGNTTAACARPHTFRSPKASLSTAGFQKFMRITEQPLLRVYTLPTDESSRTFPYRASNHWLPAQHLEKSRKLYRQTLQAQRERDGRRVHIHTHIAWVGNATRSWLHDATAEIMRASRL